MCLPFPLTPLLHVRRLGVDGSRTVVVANLTAGQPDVGIRTCLCARAAQLIGA